MVRTNTRAFVALQLVLLLGMGLFTALLATSLSRGFSPDSKVYVDSANQIAKGEGFTTTILFTDSAPTVPAPLTTWPPLYPATIAGVHKLGIGTEVAARIVALVAFSFSVVLLWLIASMLFGRTAAWISAMLLVIWPTMTGVAAMAWSENLFVFLLLVSVWTTVRSMSQTSLRRRNLLLALGGLAIGGAALTRYVGIVLIPVGGMLLIAALWTNSSRKDWLLGLVFWCLSACIPIGTWLTRNLLVAGNFAGTRHAAVEGPLFHAKYALNTLADDAFELFVMLAIIPLKIEVLGVEVFESMPVRIAILAIVVISLFMAFRRERFRNALADTLPTLWASSEKRFALGMGIGYVVAMVALRSIVGTADLLNSRMLMASYPLLLIGVVAFIVVVASKLSPRLPRFLAGGVAVLSVIAMAGIILPESISAGAPTLGRPDPSPSVRVVADLTGPGSFIVGTGVYDYNFYLGRPGLSFSSYQYNASQFDCSKISNILTGVGNQESYFILSAQNEGFDPNYMSRHGITIERLLNGESQLPLVPIYRSQELAVYKIVDYLWPCE